RCCSGCSSRGGARRGTRGGPRRSRLAFHDGRRRRSNRCGSRCGRGLFADRRRRAERGDRKVALMDRGAGAFGDLNLMDVDAVADLEPIEIDNDPFGNVVDRADHVDLMADDVQNAAAAQPGGALVVDEDDRHRDGDLSAGADPQEIDVERRVGDRMVLHLARQGALARPVDLEIDQMRKKAGLRHRAAQFARLETERSSLMRRIASAISGAIVSWRTLCVKRTASVTTMLSVRTSILIGEAATRATAPPDNTPWLT